MRGSIIIPAHNEEVLLPRCLAALAAEPGAQDLEVVVVVNGSHDATAEAARAFAPRLPRLTVLETPSPGKIGALNLGDETATEFPRIYLDADIQLRPGAVRHLVSALSTSLPRVASPHIRFDTAGSDVLVRRYYAIYERLPYVQEGLIGLGVYALSEAGRDRFDRFPDITADDLFVQRLFSPDERITVPGEFVVRAPRRWRDLLAVRTRSVQGAEELTAAPPVPGMDSTSTSASTVAALRDLIRDQPRLLPAALVYSGVTGAARLKARRTPSTWHRDESSREA